MNTFLVALLRTAVKRIIIRIRERKGSFDKERAVEVIATVEQLIDVIQSEVLNS